MVRIRSYKRKLSRKLPRLSNRFLVELILVITVLTLIIAGPGIIFSTLGPSPSFRVWVFSDTHFSDSNRLWSTVFSERLDNMKGNYNLGLVLGDVVAWRSYLTEITEFDRVLESKNLDDNFLVITGNHDTLHGGGEKTVDPYYLANISPTNTHNFLKLVDNILFIMIGDEGCYGEGKTYGLCGDSTYKWFDKTVAENQDKIIIVSSHEHLCFLDTWDQCLPYTDDFSRTLSNYNVDLWLYGHTHDLGVQEKEFPSGRKTLFVNDGAWAMDWRDIRTVLLTFTENSRVVKISSVIYSNQGDTTPEIIGIREYTLDFPYRIFTSDVSCSEDTSCKLYAGESVCNTSKGKCVECV